MTHDNDDDEDEDRQLRSVALQNANAIMLAASGPSLSSPRRARPGALGRRFAPTSS